MKKRSNRSEDNGKDKRGNHGSQPSVALNPHERKKARKDAEKLVETGINLQESGQVLEAQRAFDDALDLFPNLPGALYCKCVLQIQLLEQERNLSILWEHSVALITQLLKIIKDDTSGRGETTGFSHRALADLIFTWIKLFEMHPIPKDLELDMRRTFPTRYIIPYDKIIDQKLKLLMAADVHYDFTITILQSHNSLDEFFYEQALVKNAIFLHMLASSKMSLTSIAQQVTAEFSRIAKYLHDGIMSLNSVLHCLKSAIQTNFSNNIDTDVLALRCESLTEFWDYFDYLIQLICRCFRISEELAIQNLCSESHSTINMLATISEETSMVAESFYSLYKDDNASLLAISGDLLASYVKWDFLIIKNVESIRYSNDLYHLFISTRVSQLKIICSSIDQHSFATNINLFEHQNLERDHFSSDQGNIDSANSSKEAVELDLANYIADLGDMLALVSSLALRWDYPKIGHFIDTINREFPVLIKSLSTVLFKYPEELLLGLRSTLASFSEIGSTSELLRFTFQLFEVSLFLWKKVNDERVIDVISVCHLEFNTSMQIDGDKPYPLPNHEANLQSEESSDQGDSFEIDVCHNMACIAWRLSDEVLCQKMILRCFLLASGINTKDYLHANLDNSTWISDVVSSKCARVVENIFNDEDFQGIQSKVWFCELLVQLGIYL